MNGTMTIVLTVLAVARVTRLITSDYLTERPRHYLVHAVTHLMKRERSVASVGALPHQLGVGRAAGASVHPLHRSRRPA